MKTMILFQRKRAVVFLCAACAVLNGFGQSTVSVNVNGANVIVKKEIFGGLMERLGRCVHGGIYVGTNSSVEHINGMRKDIVEGLKECGFGALQYPGGCAAQAYNWNPPNPSNDLGTDRFMQLCSLTNCTPILTGKYNDIYAASNKAWVRYINDNPDHPDWYIKYFQMGNEVWGPYSGGEFSTWNEYKPHYDRNYDSLSIPVNNKKMSLIACTDGIWRFQQWLKDMLADDVNRIENIEVHDYVYFPEDIHGLNFSDAQYYDILNLSNEGQIRQHLDEMISILDQYDPDNRIKIWEGEWGCWLIDDGSDGWRQWGTLLEALSAGEHLNLFIRLAHRMMGAGVAQVINVIHSIMNTESDEGALVKTPTFYVFKMYIPHHTNNAKYAPTTLNSEKVNTIPAISSAATVNSYGQVHISLTNIDLTQNRTVNITLSNTSIEYACSLAQIVTGPAKNSYNKYGQAEVVNIKDFSDYSKTGDRTFSVTMPPRSIVMVSLRPIDPVVPVQHRTFLKKSGENAFSIRSESNGRVLITSSVSRKTPVTISLYRIDGRTMIDRASRTFKAGKSTCVLGNSARGKGVYIVKIVAEDVTLLKRMVVAR